MRPTRSDAPRHIFAQRVVSSCRPTLPRPRGSNVQVPLWIWLATVAGVIALLALSFFTHIRNAHEPTVREAGAWTAFFVSLSEIGRASCRERGEMLRSSGQGN